MSIHASIDTRSQVSMAPLPSYDSCREVTR